MSEALAPEQASRKPRAAKQQEQQQEEEEARRLCSKRLSDYCSCCRLSAWPRDEINCLQQPENHEFHRRNRAEFCISVGGASELAPKHTHAKLGCNSGSSTRTEMANVSEPKRLMAAYFIAELVGTFLLVVIGDGSIAAFVLTRRPVDVFCACFAFGVGAMIASFASARVSGAHINPAVSLAFALDGRLKWRLVPVYIAAQYAGGFLAALVLFLNYYEAINSLDGGQRSAFGSANSTGGVFATYPASYVTIWGALLDQVTGTAVLLFSLSAVCDKTNAALSAKHQPLVVALTVGLICVAFSPNCGAIFNPARDLAPRLICFLFGYPSVWTPLDGFYWLLAGVVGPHVGAIVGVFGYKLTIGYALSVHESCSKRAAANSQQQQQMGCHLDCDKT